MKRKFLVVLLAVLATLCMAFGLAACGEKSDETGNETGNNPSITDPSDGEQGNQGTQGGTQKPDEGGQSGTQKPDDGEQEPETYTEGLCFTEIYGEDGTTVIGYSVGAGEAADEEEIVIPSEYNNLPVLSIGRSEDDETFWNKLYEEGEGLSDEEMFTLMQKYTFYNCENLKKIKIPDSVIAIGYAAFEGCSALTEITVPNSVTSIGTVAFYGCNGLTDVAIPNSVTWIGTAAFYDCNALTEISIPFVGNGFDKTYFGYIFGASNYNDNSRFVPTSLKKVTITGGTSIGDYAFSGCGGLTSITIPDSVTSIGSYAFGACSGLAGELMIPAGVTSIGQFAFVFYGVDGLDWDNLDGLDTITVAEENSVYRSEGNCLIERATNTLLLGCKNSVIPQNITKIGEVAFLGCRWMTKLEIPNGVTEIGYFAFADCRGLTSVSIPKSVKKIDEEAFTYCNELKEVHISDLAAWCGIEFEDNPLSYAHHLFMDGQEITKLVIPNGVTSIGNYAFSGCKELTSIDIPASVTSIGDDAFYCCGLTEIKVDENNQSYHEKENCLIETKTKTLILGCNTRKITIDGSVTSIGNYAFSGCKELTSIDIPDSVASIGEGAFFGCSNLKEVHFENPNGWKVSWYSDMRNAKDISGVDDPATAAKYLTNTDRYYCFYSWKREG